MSVEVLALVKDPESDTPFIPCRVVDPELFFPESEGGYVNLSPEARTAARLCRQCDIRWECLAEAVERQEPAGIWGGYNTAQRRRLGARALRA